MDWKWGYGDGALDRWTVADAHEFLFEWCPRKLAAAPADCAEIPMSVAAFVEFLAHTGMLGAGDPPSRIRKHCEQSTARFVRAMGNPANFGMAKSLIGGLPDLHTDHDGDGDPPAIGPVRLPSDADRLASVRSAPVLARMRELARYCAAPGRTLTAKGNLRLADARHLVELLQTGDDPTMGGRRTLRSAEDLPELCWALDTAVEAGVLRRQRGKLVAVSRFAGLDDVTAHETLVPAALAVARSTPHSFFAALTRVQDFIDDCADAQLSQLLDAGDAGIAVDALGELVVHLVEAEYPGMAGFLTHSVPATARRQLERLAELGVVQVVDVQTTVCADCDRPHHHGGRAVLTPAGIPLVVELAREAGVEVLVRPEPATADAAALVDLVGVMDEDEWNTDVAVWFAAQADPGAASAELADAVTAPHRDTMTVLAGLESLATLAGDRAVELVRPHLGGPHDGLALNWMIDRSAIDPDTIDPIRLVGGLIDMLAAGLDGAGPAEVVAVFSTGSPQEHLDLLDTVWRLRHPRLPDVLDAVGTHHPTKVIAKAARKALVRHRSMLADQRSSAAPARGVTSSP